MTDLSGFVAVARHLSFRRAAELTGVSRSTLSHAVIDMERELGVRLFNRTTRSISLTEAGAELLRRTTVLLRDYDEALDAMANASGIVGGTLRINCTETAANRLLAGVVPVFLRQHPQVALDFVTDGRLVDIVAGGFDAGVRLRDSVPKDMVAVPFGGAVRFIAVASPDYLADHGMPMVPDDLLRHRCIRHRLPSGKVHRWDFEKHGQEAVIDVSGALTLDNPRLMTEAAANGLGIAFVPENAARRQIAVGGLLPVLAEWCPEMPGLCLYYPGHRQVRATLRAFIDTLKQARID
ncbi:LysR family transcriptional regulator [Stakelama flava]|uniref:LysR family transcriptional regulator n=1 Tax=Stakelama flava TaxID=2860338 RepID=UPI001FE38439|nr:LysR family transcriptional regulator [Stakelama flava]